VPAALLATALLAGCTSEVAGTASPARTGHEVVADAAAALEQAGAFTVRGTATRVGQQVTVDVHVQGEDSAGTYTVDGGTVQFVRLGGVTYVQGTPRLWSAAGVPTETATQLSNTWFMVPDGMAALDAPHAIDQMAAELRIPGESPVVDAVRTTTLDGAPVHVVAQADGGELWVAASGPAYPLHADDWGADTKLTFSDFGVRQDITAPAGAVDLSQFGGG
jgi:hypothetical protein